MNKTVSEILANMRDTDDQKVGAVFEKEVKTNLADFCLFILSQYKNVTMRLMGDMGNKLYIFYNGPAATDHIATYIPFREIGCFGGLRVGSENPCRKPGDPEVENPLQPKEAAA